MITIPIQSPFHIQIATGGQGLEFHFDFSVLNETSFEGEVTTVGCIWLKEKAYTLKERSFSVNSNNVKLEYEYEKNVLKGRVLLTTPHAELVNRILLYLVYCIGLEFHVTYLIPNDSQSFMLESLRLGRNYILLTLQQIFDEFECYFDKFKVIMEIANEEFSFLLPNLLENSQCKNFDTQIALDYSLLEGISARTINSRCEPMEKIDVYLKSFPDDIFNMYKQGELHTIGSWNKVRKYVFHGRQNSMIEDIVVQQDGVKFLPIRFSLELPILRQVIIRILDSKYLGGTPWRKSGGLYSQSYL